MSFYVGGKRKIGCKYVKDTLYNMKVIVSGFPGLLSRQIRMDTEHLGNLNAIEKLPMGATLVNCGKAYNSESSLVSSQISSAPIGLLHGEGSAWHFAGSGSCMIRLNQLF